MIDPAQAIEDFFRNPTEANLDAVVSAVEVHSPHVDSVRLRLNLAAQIHWLRQVHAEIETCDLLIRLMEPTK